MKKLYFVLVFVFIAIVSVNAQDAIKDNNPLTEVRFNLFKHSMTLFNEYLDTDNGSFNTTNLRVLYPIGNRYWLLRVDVPLISANTTSINKSGLGDIAVAASYVPYVRNKNRDSNSSKNNLKFCQ
jgi:hypothetical protein